MHLTFEHPARDTQAQRIAFRRLIGRGCPAYIPRDGLGPVEAIRAIRAAGGLPVLAHFAEAASRESLVRELMVAGLGGLEVFYRTMADTARNALHASFSDNAGYRKAAAEMMTVLAGLGDVDTASRTLATTVGPELPPVALPRVSAGGAAPLTSLAPAR